MKKYPTFALLFLAAAFFTGSSFCESGIEEILDPCDSPLAWDRARGPARLAREYVLDNVSAAVDHQRGKVIRWNFKLRSINYSDLFLRRRIKNPFETISLSPIPEKDSG